MTRTGQCMCGAVRFTAWDVHARYGACHCTMCQKWAGSALLAVTVPADRIEWQGLEHAGRIQSSSFAERAWCNKCGSGLWYRGTEAGEAAEYELPIGLFDDPNGFVMAREIFVDTASDSFAFAGTRPRLTAAELAAERQQQ